MSRSKTASKSDDMHMADLDPDRPWIAGGLRKPAADRALSAKSRICAHRGVNFGLRMANTEGMGAFCVGLADLTCCVACRWLLSAIRRVLVHERNFPAHADRRSVRCRHVCRSLPRTLCYFVVLAGLHTTEKGDAKLCDELLQASAGDMAACCLASGGRALPPSRRGARKPLPYHVTQHDIVLGLYPNRAGMGV